MNAAVALIAIIIATLHSTDGSPCAPSNKYPTDTPHLAAREVAAHDSYVVIKGVYEADSFFPPPLTQQELKGVIVAKIDGRSVKTLDALDFVDKEFVIRLGHVAAGRHLILVDLIRANSVMNGFSACIDVPDGGTITKFRS